MEVFQATTARATGLTDVAQTHGPLVQEELCNGSNYMVWPDQIA